MIFLLFFDVCLFCRGTVETSFFLPHLLFLKDYLLTRFLDQLLSLHFLLHFLTFSIGPQIMNFLLDFNQYFLHVHYAHYRLPLIFA